jgi:RNA polymerase sigma-70 factor (ECF subfamily)
MALNPKPDEQRTWPGNAPPLNNVENDRQLVNKMIRRDESACGELYDRYSRLVFSVALRVTNDRSAAEDIVHDLFLQLWLAPERFDSARGQLGPWLAVMARNRSIDWQRRQKNTVAPEDVVLSADVDVVDQVETAALMGRVRRLLGTMPEKQRSALEMAFFDGLTHVDIAAKTGEPLGTIKTRIRTGLTAIRQALNA